MKTRTLICALTLVGLLGACSQPTVPHFDAIYSPAKAAIKPKFDWQSDIEFIRNELPKAHKNLFFAVSKEKFDRQLDSISRQANGKSDLYNAIRLQQVIADMGDAHTSLGFEDWLDASQQLPFTPFWFDDGLYIIEASPSHERLLGAKILSVNGRRINEITQSLATLITQDNNALIKTSVPYYLVRRQLLDALGFATAGDALTLQVQTASGATVSETFPPGDHADELRTLKPQNQSFSLQHPDQLFWAEYREDERLLFVQYNQCWSRELQERRCQSSNPCRSPSQFPSINEFARVLLATVKEKPFDRFVFDLRFNGGGSSSQGTNLIQALKQTGKLNGKGKVYVLIGRETFSSAIINALDFQDAMSITFVGEETGGRPNHYGEVKTLTLPSSGLPLYYSSKYFHLTDRYTNTIEPDIKVKMSFADYVAGRDPALDAIRKGKV